MESEFALAAFSLEPFVGALVIGASMAGILLLVALGLTVIYGMMGVINMAHGEFIMLGAYTTFVFQTLLGFPLLLCMPLAFIVVAAIGYLIERALIRRLYERPLDTLLATWGLSLMLIQAVRLTFGGDPKFVGAPAWMRFRLEFWYVQISGLRLFIIIFSLLLVALTWWIMKRTRVGLQIQAVMQDRETASAFGIDSSKVYSWTFAYGAGLAGLAGSLLGGLQTLFPDMGSRYIVEAFLVVVVGGAQVFGSVLSAGLLGELSSVFSFFTNETVARFLLFTMVVVFLRFKPNGLTSSGATRR